MGTGMPWRCGVVWLASGASLLCCALGRVAQLLGCDAPALRVTQTGGEEIIDQPCHGTAQPPAFMIQSADDDPVDAGRIMGSPGHGGWMRRPRISPGRSNLYNANAGRIAVRGTTQGSHYYPRKHTSIKVIRSKGKSVGTVKLRVGLGSKVSDKCPSEKISNASFTHNSLIMSGAPGRDRTCDQPIRNRLLYPLSYGCLTKPARS